MLHYTNKTLSHRPLDADRTILVFAGIMVYPASVPLQAKMGYVESHPVHGRDSIRSSKVKPINYRLYDFRMAINERNLV